MCGIIAVLLGARFPSSKSEKQFCFQLLLKSLRALQNRGYDSCGVIDSRFKCLLRAVKGTELNGSADKSLPDDAVDQIELLGTKFPECKIGIAHTRWATHGSKTVNNAHPHLSYDDSVAVIHNGILENYLALREKLESKGCTFRSQTDTEIISSWIARRINVLRKKEAVYPGLVLRAIREGQKIFQGTWAIAVLHKDLPDCLFLAKKGSPLLVGYQRDTGLFMATSEIAGFVNRVDRYAVLKDGDVLQLSSAMTPQDLRRQYDLKFQAVPKETIKLTPHPFPHWMCKEIYDQTQAVEGPGEWGSYKNEDETIIDSIPELKQLFPLREKLLNYDSFDVLLVGCGTSYHAGLSGRWFFRSFPFHSIRVVVASEFTDQDIPKCTNGVSKNVLAILISQSGETKDVHRALRVIKKAHIPTIALVNVPNSMIARESDYAVHLNAGREVAVASTKAYVSQIVGLRLIATALGEGPGSLIPEDCVNLNQQVRKTLLDVIPYSPFANDGVHDFVVNPALKKIALAMHEKNHGFVLSTGTFRATAYEAALKIKEIGRIWVQGYPTGALKHGPFSLIERGTPVIFALQDGYDDVRKRTESAIEEVHARKARVFVITDIEDYNNNTAEEIIHVPKNNTMGAILAIIPFQALSYYTAILRNLDADKPVHLAKVVTTD